MGGGEENVRLIKQTTSEGGAARLWSEEKEVCGGNWEEGKEKKRKELLM